ncbi:uncharacterized protein LOC108207584 isoform X2 [Daucus carota subsp. sativus]|nr:PREDICTED: uncharacterized protein LOC108207584 isoform X1 [Daucus carota subsp. sativus]XP_017233516.1 PREDICTED: uncharacterized protein LOC108207584 isoform X1 [Daucus carota subsp. sativus]
MHCPGSYNCCISLLTLALIVSILPFCHGDLIRRALNVGEELQKETLPLKSGSCLYQISGLKSQTWYEVKISYPASIPASFSIHLKRDDSNLELKQQRKLLNTEKLIFESGDAKIFSEQGGTFVLVSVEPEGFVAIPHVQERKEIIYNIVCDELVLGIPHKAWWVVILVIICLGLAALVPRFLPSYLLEKDLSPQLIKEITSKDS